MKEGDDYLNDKTEGYTYESSVQDLQSTSIKLKNKPTVRKSQRAPKKKKIKSYGFVPGKNKKRKMSIEETEEESPEKKNTIVSHTPAEQLPSHNVRYDQIGHYPESDIGKSSSFRCKLKGCGSRTTIFCIKCNVHLCVRTGKKCFKNFHTLKIEPE